MDESIQYTSFNNMHKMEKEGVFNSNALRPADEKDQDSYKTRKGKVGGYQDYMSKDKIAYINDKMRNELPEELGYSLSL